MLKPITLEEVLELVTFANLDGKWVIRDVLSDVWGDVRADVLGDVLGHVQGSYRFTLLDSNSDN